MRLSHPLRAVTATAAGALALGALPAAASASPARPLPHGVVRLADSRPCPRAVLCLYRDYGRSGPAYAVRPGYPVELSRLPMSGRTAANNVSSWVNNTRWRVVLVDTDRHTAHVVGPRSGYEEPWSNNDTEDLVLWLP
ncbi:peptidase inhibitor family I36 protein [Actinomadura atramentaria]|uniref:peptidase inhibitor family I36 protein n=1 Tax=Actinomadura atramentaria TaxID=1990 RepID=UPI0003750788|nr:peptidase inhibitor family I36 protein [Actinomadura atramentaria]